MERNIIVTPEQLERAAGKIEGLASEYKTLYDQLYSETGELAAAWSGKDNTAFTDQIEGFKDDFQKMFSLMNCYVDFLRVSAKSYAETQDSAVSRASKLIN